MNTLNDRLKGFALIPVVLLLVALMLAVSSRAEAQSAAINWGPWRLNATIQSNGLALTGVYFNNRQVIYKANMPVIRVLYVEPPAANVAYADILGPGLLYPVPFCNNQMICQRSFTRNGVAWLELGVYAQIGGYQIYQAWYLSANGAIQPQLFSRGLHHNADHYHHIYWRLDMDIDGAGSDQIFVYDNNRPNIGWGPGWSQYPSEFEDVRSPATGRVWFVRDANSGNGMWIVPGSGDGFADNFSRIDAAGRIYHWGEDTWPFGARGEIGWNNGEDLRQKDVVFWYVAHLFHRDEEGTSVWHSGGPTLWAHPR